MNTQTRIYASGALAFGEDQAISNLLTANYSAVIVWSVHVATDGTLILNNTQFVSNGVYAEAEQMNLPSRLAQLHKAGIQIIFSVGAGGTQDFTNIQQLLNGGVPTQGNPLYDNFSALKAAMVSAGGDIDAIDFDNEDNMNTATMVNFGCMLANIGYSSVTLCPYYTDPVWTDTYNQLLAKQGNGFVSAIHLQCYSGGMSSNPQDWGKMIADGKGNTLLIAGLATNQADPGTWWDGSTQQPGGSVVKTSNVAMYKDADWSGLLRIGNYSSPDIAMQNTKGGETFFFYCNQFIDLGPGKQFMPGDAVFFGGRPWWGSAPQCDAYSLSGACTNIYNSINYDQPCGACPSDLQSQYAQWKNGKYPVNGGFIWLYDSIVNCLLSNCCGEGNENTAQVATDYKEAIINGLN